ncbi:hypothetical protein LL033_15960 [Clostridium estertheticum]|uniref:hypothetical protein n=1 Tax=Clostridium estertheticum TaxID=238834 RepID=UPI001C0D2766|nr:hypothetical protein [Clostridium estertheticum]MBU3215881.1 hypothetical protein [Clostridium estertheticum]WAG54131.1 hypothetical protein LL033_15960 [Clostridium estertheticum]
MKFSHKVTTIFLLGFVALSAVGCSNSQKTAEQTTPKSSTQVASKTTTQKSTTKPASTAASKTEATSKTKLDTAFVGSKDIKKVKVSDYIYNEEKNKPYVKGEYKEVDFTIDLISRYLNGDATAYKSIVSYPADYTPGLVSINAKDKGKLVDYLKILKIQLKLKDGQAVNVKALSVQYDGPDLVTKKGVSIMLKVGINPNGEKSTYWTFFGAQVFEKDGKLVAKLSQS